MELKPKPYADIYKEITNYWKHGTSCTLTSLPVCGLENYKHLNFVTQGARRKVTSDHKWLAHNHCTMPIVITVLANVAWVLSRLRNQKSSVQIWAWSMATLTVPWLPLSLNINTALYLKIICDRFIHTFSNSWIKKLSYNNYINKAEKHTVKYTMNQYICCFGLRTRPRLAAAAYDDNVHP
jgi:hypothetical protein